MISDWSLSSLNVKLSIITIYANQLETLISGSLYPILSFRSIEGWFYCNGLATLIASSMRCFRSSVTTISVKSYLFISYSIWLSRYTDKRSDQEPSSNLDPIIAFPISLSYYAHFHFFDNIWISLYLTSNLISIFSYIIHVFLLDHPFFFSLFRSNLNF